MYILLDIDGVMVSAASWKPVTQLEDNFYAFNDEAVKALNSILSVTNASIIITSSHRSSYTLPEWIDIFKTRGLDVPISKLDDNPYQLSRKDEIVDWFNNRTTTERFVIIDDDMSLYGLPDGLKSKWVMINSLMGLNKGHVLNALKILKNG